MEQSVHAQLYIMDIKTRPETVLKESYKSMNKRGKTIRNYVKLYDRTDIFSNNVNSLSNEFLMKLTNHFSRMRKFKITRRNFFSDIETILSV